MKKKTFDESLKTLLKTPRLIYKSKKMRTDLITNIPRDMSISIKKSHSRIMKMLEDKYILDEKTKMEIHSELRMIAMDGFNLGSYILGNMQKDLSSELIDYQYAIETK